MGRRSVVLTAVISDFRKHLKPPIRRLLFRQFYSMRNENARQAFMALSENKKQQFCNLQNFVDRQKLFYAENRVYGPEFNVWAMLTAKM